MIEAYKTSNYRLSTFVGTAIGILSTAFGALLSFADAWIAAGVLMSATFVTWALIQSEIALWSTILIFTLIPFGTLPFKLILTPTFLDITIGVVYLVFLSGFLNPKRRAIAFTPAHIPIIIFMLLSILSFVVGLGNAVHSPNLFRKFVGYVLNIGLGLIIVEQVHNRTILRRLIKIIVVSGFVAAIIGLVLYFAPQSLAERSLNQLSVFNYPSGNVLRYIEDNPTNPLRAIGTSVDPNIFGGLLAIVAALLVPQISTRTPIFRRRSTTILMLFVITMALFLTYSRTAMTALLVSMIFIATIRYRSLFWIIAGTILLVSFLPWSQQYVSHFIDAIKGQDLATSMRFGEYKDALVLISRYPAFGVGFGGAPDADIYLGVSSAYLLLAEQVGLIGLTGFLVVIATVFIWGMRHRLYALTNNGLASQWLGIYGALLAMTIIGVFDHYFVNLEFQSSQTFFWFVVGLALAVTRISQELK